MNQKFLSLILVFIFYGNASNAIYTNRLNIDERDNHDIDALSGDLDRLTNELESIDDPGKQGKLWVVLAAGSWGWANYRHQADVCHAYHIVRQHGIPDERIVVFMKDDIANNSENPNAGVIMNSPNGTNVYKGVPKDYTGDNLDPMNFMNVLLGKTMNVGRRSII